MAKRGGGVIGGGPGHTAEQQARQDEFYKSSLNTRMMEAKQRGVLVTWDDLEYTIVKTLHTIADQENENDVALIKVINELEARLAKLESRPPNPYFVKRLERES